MLGIEPSTQRRRMEESLDAIMALLKCEEPVTIKTDWFELREARLHLAPYSDPCFDIAIASTLTPAAPMLAGKHGVGMLSLGAGMPGGPQAIAGQWRIAEEQAAKHGKTMDRSKWRMVMNVHVAEDDATALRDVRVGERAETVGYFTDVLGRPPGRSEDPLSDGVKAGTTLVGSPDTVAAGIESLLAHSDGGFGGFMFRAHDWANREQTWRSYELFARYVMPRFQGSLDTVRASFEWAKANRSTIFGPNVAAIRKAYEDAGREVPEGFDARLTGAGALNPAK
jgi:limonene 1,2-monooxygenase